MGRDWNASIAADFQLKEYQNYRRQMKLKYGQEYEQRLNSYERMKLNSLFDNIDQWNLD